MSNFQNRKIIKWQKIVQRKGVPPTPILWKFQPLNRNEHFLELAGGHLDYLFYWRGGLSGVSNFYFRKDNLNKIDNFFCNLIIRRNKKLIKTFKINTRKTTKKILSTFALFIANKLDQKQNQELYQILNNYKKALSSDFVYGFLMTLAVEKFQSYLKKILLAKIRKNSNLDLNTCFVRLTAPNRLSWIQKEKRSLVRIIKIIKKDKKAVKLFCQPINKIISSLKHFGRINLLLESHYKKFFWLPYEYIGPGYSKMDFVKAIKSKIKQKLETDFNMAKIKKEKLKIIKELKIGKKYQDLFEIMSYFTELKDYRNGIETLSFTRLEKILMLIARRYNLTKEEIYFFHPNEITDLLLKNKKPIDLNGRKRYCINLVKGNSKKFLSGKAASNLFQKEIQEKIFNIQKINKIRGIVANTGIVRGKVRILEGIDEIKKMKRGEILVTAMTTPDYISAVEKAKAIVTDEGGMTCHAAIVSREFKIPCIVGTKIATKTFKDGDLIEVNAHQGIVKKLR